MTTSVAYPFVDVTIDTSQLTPRAQPAGGVLAVIGESDAGTAPMNQPRAVGDPEEAGTLFAGRNGNQIVPTPLYTSLKLAFLQQRRPQLVYGVRTAPGDQIAGLAAIEALDVAVVCLAGVHTIGTPATDGKPATGLCALVDHVDTLDGNGQRRIGVGALTDPLPDDLDAFIKQAAPLLSAAGRMVLFAAPGAQGDVGVAAAAVIASLPPQASLVLKPIQGITIGPADQPRPSAVAALAAGGINPIIDTPLIPGPGLYLAEGKAFTKTAAIGYVDTRRVIDHVEFLLRAGLIGTVGDARITREGLTLVKQRCEGVLAPLVRDAVIAEYGVVVPVLDILGAPRASWSAADQSAVEDARSARTVDVRVSITYGPAVHHLKVNLVVGY